MLPCVIDACQIGGWVYRGIVPWNKGDGSRPVRGWFRRQCEYIVTASAGPLPQEPDGESIFAMGFFTIPTIQSAARCHLTEKPESLTDLMIGIKSEWKTILDPFMGSGTTGVSSLRLGRKFIGIELSREYFDIACKRIEAASKAQPLLFEEGVNGG